MKNKIYQLWILMVLVAFSASAQNNTQQVTAYQYYFDTVSENLASKVIGHFTQYPLKLAWAVTIHKSQGQTFEKVIIDVGFGTFSHGQMYVALSRCTSLGGVILKQPLVQRHILLDQRVVEFHHKKVLAKPIATLTSEM